MTILTPVTDQDDIHDAWALTTQGYAVDKLYIRASDSVGHADLIHVKVAPNLAAMVNAAVADPNLAYRTKADVVRDALVHRFRQLAEMRKLGREIEQRWGEEVLNERLAEHAEREAIRRALVERLYERCGAAIKANQRSRMYDWLDEYEDTVLSWDDIDERRAGIAEVRRLREYVDNQIALHEQSSTHVSFT
jgi:hypothetical protein